MDFPVYYNILHSLRIKVTDRCAWNCWWCHNEGTGKRNTSLIGDVYWNEDTECTIRSLRNALHFSEVHLTGGEPTAHPNLESLVSGLIGIGLEVKATTIGCATSTLDRLIKSGLNNFNFSLHSVDADTFSMTQIDRSMAWSQTQLHRELEAIRYAKELKANVQVNIVVGGYSDISRALRVIEWSMKNDVHVRLLNELANEVTSVDAVLQILDLLGSVEIKRIITRGSSSYTSHYITKDGIKLTFKRINDFVLNSMCYQCELLHNECRERFYGVRLERRKTSSGEYMYFVRLCIHKSTHDTVMTVSQFLDSRQLQEIQQAIQEGQ